MPLGRDTYTIFTNATIFCGQILVGWMFIDWIRKHEKERKKEAEHSR